MSNQNYLTKSNYTHMYHLPIRMNSVTESEVISNIDTSELLPLLSLKRVVFEQEFSVAVSPG